MQLKKCIKNKCGLNVCLEKMRWRSKAELKKMSYNDMRKAVIRFIAEISYKNMLVMRMYELQLLQYCRCCGAMQ